MARKRTSERSGQEPAKPRIVYRDKDCVIVLVLLKPGQATKSTKHQNSYVVIPLTGGLMRREIIEGDEVVTNVVKLAPFKGYLREVGELGLYQSVTNVGKDDIEFLKVPTDCLCDEKRKKKPPKKTKKRRK